MSTRKPSYTPTPAVPPELLPRLAAIVEVLAGLKTVSAAARSLGLSRNHFQTLLHRGVLSLRETLTLKTGGRPAKASALAALETELLKLRRENTRLQARVSSTERLLEVAGGLLHGRIRPSARQRRTRKTTGSRSEHEDNDPEARRQRVLSGVDEMCHLGLTQRLAAAVAGVDVATLRRWRSGTGAWGSAARSSARQITPAAALCAGDLVRRLHGLIGVEALRHSVPGLSRRAAACVKSHTLTAMERERKIALRRVTIAPPGILRGLDAMHLSASDGPLYALIAADGAIPYRTTLALGPRYDTALVTRTLEADLARHGAPLILRLDRARAHATPAVRELLEAHGVLLLHGPPRYPCFYGQLERQNREHRAWCAALVPQPRALIEPCLQDMLHSVNALWRRRTLHWQTASEAWSARPSLNIDRTAFREEVHERALRIAHRLKRERQPVDLAERLAIERTLEQKGYLRQEIGGWC